MLSPDVGNLLRAQSDTAIAKAINESNLTMLTYRLAYFCVFPFAGALIYEWRTPGGISRQSFRLPFFQQAYLCGPLAIVMSVASVIAVKFTDDGILGFTGLALITILFWYFWTQTIFFRQTLDSSKWGARFWGFLSVALGITFSLLLDFIVGA